MITLSQLEGRDPEYFAVWQDGWRTIVHARAAEDLTQAVPPRERHGLRIVFRHIEKNGLARRDVSESTEQDICDFCIRGEQGSILNPCRQGRMTPYPAVRRPAQPPGRGSPAG